MSSRKKNEKDTVAIVVGERAHPRRRRRRCRQYQAQVHTQALYNPFNNLLYYISPPSYQTDFRSNPNNEMRQKLRDTFTPIGESYASLFKKLVQPDMITLLLGYTLDPHSRSFDPSVRCAYHSDVQHHSIKDYRALKREIEKMIQDKSIMVQNIDSEKSSDHDDIQTSG
ncbi:hypothetical protein P3S68_032372 [Capsicum galapagoense]